MGKEKPNTIQEIEEARTSKDHVWLKAECRCCGNVFGFFNRTLAATERICTGCACFASDEDFHKAQLKAVIEYPDRYENGTREKLEAYLRGEIAKWELRS